MNGYNGWTNWHTWNANLWLTNDEIVYETLIHALDANEVEYIYSIFFMENHDRIDTTKVNWSEIYNGLNPDKDHVNNT